MARDISKESQQKEITLDLSKVPREDRLAVKEEVGNFIYESVLEAVEKGKSPVQGEGNFKRLNKKYAEKEKGGRTTPNLELEGDMLEALGFKNTREGIQFGIQKKAQAAKADGHNQIEVTKHPFELPKRRFIPAKNQNFTKKIEDGIKKIIRNFEVSAEAIIQIPTPRPAPPATTEKTETATEFIPFREETDLFSDEFLEALILRELNKRRDSGR